MNFKLIFLFLIPVHFVSAQTFTEVPLFGFHGVTNSAIAFSDVDGDGDEDVLVTGASNQEQIAKLYVNDGEGRYDEVTETPFTGVWDGSVAFSDVDGDGDNDVLIAGWNNDPRLRNAKLYTNDGLGHFTEMTGTPFGDVYRGSITFSDVDGDGDNDVFITGIIPSNTGGSSTSVAKLYSNDGTGNFIEVSGSSFDRVTNSSIAFSDIDGDGDNDLLISGWNAVLGQIAKLYTNDGTGTFTEVTDTPFEGVDYSSIAFSDIDGDGDNDLLISGKNSADVSITKLYTNDGTGTFDEVISPPFNGIVRSSIAFSDIDGDGDSDVLIAGVTSKFYINDGSGNFTEDLGTPFADVSSSSIAFSDVDGDGDQDVLITGMSNYEAVTKLYYNDGRGDFTENIPPIAQVSTSSIAFFDVDGDGDEDVLVTGEIQSGDFSTAKRVSKLYKNNGVGTFTEVTGTPFEGVRYGSIAFSDVDDDGDNDVLITGMTQNWAEIASLYINDGTGGFTIMSGTPFEAVRYSSIAFSDVDGDGDQDVLIAGEDDRENRISKLYTNDGTGNYTEVMDTPFVGVMRGSIAFSDVDNDGDNDVLITGLTNPTIGGVDAHIARLYSNNGAGRFTEVTNTIFTGVRYSSVAFADVDGDGDSDVLIAGQSWPDYESSTKLYTNNGGTFTENSTVHFDAIIYASFDFSDVDGDGDSDVLISGYNGIERIAKLYVNDGLATFTELPGTSFKGVSYGSIAFSDMDGDGDSDLLITGSGSANLYTNDGRVSEIDELVFNSTINITLFPNPTSPTILFLNYDALTLNKITLKVYNTSGVLQSQVRKSAVLGQQTISIDISSLAKGTYFIELDNGMEKGIGKFVVH